MVRKKLKWNSKPFEIPQNILDEWRKIGNNGELLEKKWHEIVNKKNSKIKDILDKNFEDTYLEKLDNLIKKEKTKYFETKPSLATRQLSLIHI